MAGSLYRVELGLLWSTLLLSAGVVAMGAVLAGLRVRSPRLHRAGFSAALLAGWAWVLALLGLPGVALRMSWLRPTGATVGEEVAGSIGGEREVLDSLRDFEELGFPGVSVDAQTGEKHVAGIGPELAAVSRIPASDASSGLVLNPGEQDQAMGTGVPDSPGSQVAANQLHVGKRIAPRRHVPTVLWQSQREGDQEIGRTKQRELWPGVRTWLAIVAALGWFAGVVATLARWARGYIFVARRSRGAIAAPADVLSMWNDMLVRRGARRESPVVLDAELGPALLWLPRRYMLVLPADHWPGLSLAEQKAVLLHELAHWLRGDLWKSLAVRIAALPHWFNPLAWLAVRRFEAAAEWACDQFAAADSLETRKSFVRAILALKSPRLSGWPSTVSASRDVLERVQRLAPDFPQGDPVMKRLMFFVAVALVLAAGAVRPAAPGNEWALAAEGTGQAVGDLAVPPNAPESRGVMAAGQTDAGPAVNSTAGEKDKLGLFPADRLRYQNQTFQEWQAKGEDLSLEVRCEVARAMAAFGANGMPGEAAEAILKLVAGVKTWMVLPQQAGGKLAAQAIVSLGGTPIEGAEDASYVIPVSATLPVLIRYLRQGTPGQQYVVAAAIAQAAREGVDITPAVPELCTLLEQLRERELAADARWATSSVWFTRADFAPPICQVMREALTEAGGSAKAAIQYLESVCKKHPIEIFCAEVERFYWAAGGTHIPYRVKFENVRLKNLRTYLVDLAKSPAAAESMAGIRSLARLGLHLGPAVDTLIDLFAKLDEARQAELLKTLDAFCAASGQALGKGTAGLAGEASGYPGVALAGGTMAGYGLGALYGSGGFGGGMALPALDAETARELEATRNRIRQFAEQQAATAPSAAIRQQAAKLAASAGQ